MISNFYGNAKYPGYVYCIHTLYILYIFPIIFKIQINSFLFLSLLFHLGVTGPGHWQDPDMMVVGMPGLTFNEWRTHFSLWAISAAPMWIGIDLTVVTDDVVGILNNTEVIAVDQDSDGIAAINVDQENGDYNVEGEIYWKRW